MRLVRGMGSPTTGACWMSAINYYMSAGRKGFAWSDHPECVCPTIRPLAIVLNDLCRDGEREALIGPHLFTPVGTATTDRTLMQRRAFRAADMACRVWAPRALERRGCAGEAATLRALAPIVDEATARAAAAAAAAADAADAADAANAAAAAARAAAAYATAYAAYAYAAAAAKQELLALILELCAMGAEDRAPLTPCRTKEQTIAEVCR